MSTIVHQHVAIPRAPVLQSEFGYTLGWDLVTVHRSDGEALGRVVSLSPERALAVLDRPAACRVGDRGLLVFPDSSGLPPVQTSVVRGSAPTVSGDWLVELRLQPVPLPVVRHQLAWLGERVRCGEALPPDTTLCEIERIIDPRRIERILRMLCQQRSSGVIIGGGTGHRGAAVRAVIEPPGRLLIEWERGVSLKPPLRVAMTGYNSVYEFVWPDSPRFSLSTDEILRRRRRRFRRALAPPRVRVTLGHPLVLGATIRRRVHDVSFDGLSFLADPVEDVLYPGLELGLELDWKGGALWRFAATVRHCTVTTNGKAVCGVELRHPGDERRRAWCAEVDGLLNPRVERWLDAHALWRLYEDSGYFGLSGRTPNAFEHLRSAFAAKGVACARGSRVLMHVGARGGGRLEAAISRVEAWSGSWLLYQAARQPSERPLIAAGDDMLRDAYVRAVESVASVPSARHLVIFVQDDARTPRWFQLSFAQRLARSGRASITPFRALEFRTKDLLRPSRRSACVDLARADERAAAHAWFRAHRPAHYVAATGVGEGHLELGAVVGRWRAAGLERAREVFVARHEGRAEAVLLAERADPGVHLFGLLDIARFVPLAAGGRRHLPDLLRAAAQWHADARRRRFVYFEEDVGASPTNLGAVEDLGLAHTVVIPVDGLPAFLEHIHEITAPATPLG